MAATMVGPLLKEWRHRRRRSQLDLALDAGVSARHLSFIETGRSRPSPEVVLTLAQHLDVPLRERNELLLAAGYAPRYPETTLQAPAMERVRAALELVLAAHDPFPAVVVDRRWDVVLANQGATMFMDGIPTELMQPTLNVFRVSLHPEGMAPRIVNFPEWALHLVTQLRRLVYLTADPDLHELLREVQSYPGVTGLGLPRDLAEAAGRHELVIHLRIRHGDDVLGFFSTMTTFGTPLDVTLDELAVESFFPADQRTDDLMRGVSR